MGAALVEASSGVAIGAFFLLLLFCPPTASGSFSLEREVPVSDAVAGIERAPADEVSEAELGAFVGAARDCGFPATAARFPRIFCLRSITGGVG